MKILLRWLREYVDLGAEPIDVDALSETLTMLGLAVEGVERTGGVAGRRHGTRRAHRDPS